jgi:hypothetical protein
MDLKRTLKLLSKLEADGKLVAETAHVPDQFDPNHAISLTVRAVDAATRAQFLAAENVAPAEAEPEPQPEPEPPAAPKVKRSLLKREPRATKATKAKK